jgi:hypothetical protein
MRRIFHAEHRSSSERCDEIRRLAKKEVKNQVGSTKQAIRPRYNQVAASDQVSLLAHPPQQADWTKLYRECCATRWYYMPYDNARHEAVRVST